MLRNIRTLLCTTTALITLAAGPAFANPQGAQVVGGAATVQGQGTNNVTVNQTTNRAIINWNTFNIGSGDTTTFVQPNSSSVALNRVTGNLGPSQIFGTLNANGRIFLINPDGVLFGGGAVINTGGFLASTNDIKNSDFMAGRYLFNIPGRPDASIVNLGTITAQSGGFAALVAPGVRNSGTITATLGKVALASGNAFTLDFYGDSLINLAVGDQIATTVKDVATGKSLDALVKNEGTIKANGGRVELTAAAARQVVDAVINNTGVIEANTVGTRNGMIVLGAATAKSKPSGAPTQTVKVSGRLSVAGKNRGEKGGTIRITGENIALSTADIDASGVSDGGHVLIGGDVSGGKSNPLSASMQQAALEPLSVPTASNVTIDAGTTIDASSKDNGNGGKVVVWADQTTTFYGTILARGGNISGDGGFVETSGHVLDVNGARVNTSAPNGRTGTWLLDPYNLLIDLAAATTISTNLATSNVDVVTTATGYSGPGTAVAGDGDIQVASNITWSSGNTLTVSAFRNINVNSGITIANTGSGNLTLQSDNTGTGTGGVFFSPNSFVDFSQSTGTVSISYNTNSVIGVQTNPNATNQLQLNLYAGQAVAAYMTGSSDPWGISPSDAGSPDAAMNTAFGSGNWTKFYGFNTAVLNGEYKLVYMDGGASIASEFNNFVGNNVASLESFVQSGGALFLNAARWTGGTDPYSYQSGALDVGFGTTLNFDASYSLASNSGTAVDPTDPIFNGPNGSAGTSWTGNYFSHDTVTGNTLDPMITGTNGVVLAGGQVGSGYVMVGGMTSPNFQQPDSQASILRANILSYAASQSTISASTSSPTPPKPPSSTQPSVPLNVSLNQTYINNFTQPLFNPPNNNANINLTLPQTTSTGSTGGTSPGTTGSVNGSQMPLVRPPEAPIASVPPPGENRFVADQAMCWTSASRQQVESLARRLGVTVIGSQSVELLGTRAYQFRLASGGDVRDVIRRAEASGICRKSQPNYRFALSQTASVSASTAEADESQYAIKKLLLPAAHRLSNGDNVLVAVIDSAIDAKHPELTGTVVDRFDATGFDNAPDKHGTGTAGAIAAHLKLMGVAPHAHVLAATAFSPKTGSAEATTLQILKAIDWAVRKGAKVINMSFAGPPDPGLQRALNAAHAKGIVLIAAAGNAGPKSPPLYPGANRYVIAVTATDSDDRLFPGSNRGAQIAVAAPGVDILLPAPGAKYQVTTGTSFSCALVSGVAALMLARNPSLKPDDVRRILMVTAKDLGPKGFDKDYGAGLVDTYKALMAAGEKTTRTSAVRKKRRR